MSFDSALAETASVSMPMPMPLPAQVPTAAGRWPATGPSTLRPFSGMGTVLPATLLLAALDEVDHGLLLLDADGRVRWANRVAQRRCRAGAVLALRDQRLHCDALADAELLQRALTTARAGRRSMLRLGRGAVAQTVAVVPLAEVAVGEAPAVLLVLGKCETHEPLTLQFFAQMHKLTPAEAGVLDGLCRGMTPTQIATDSQVALCTVRSQISAAREKTHARSIAQLLRMVSTLPPMVSAIGEWATN